MNNFELCHENFISSQVHLNGKSLYILKDFFHSYNFKRIGDVGCGPGHSGLLFSQKSDEVVFFDPSNKMLESAKELVNKSVIKKASFFNISAKELNPDYFGKFDLIITRLAFHHFDNPQKSIEAMCSCLNPNGYLIISDLYAPNDENLYKINHDLEILHDSTHVKNYSLNDFEDYMNLSNINYLLLESKIILELEEGLLISNWCDITKSSKESQIIDKLNTISLKDREELGYFLDENLNLRNSVKTQLLIFKIL